MRKKLVTLLYAFRNLIPIATFFKDHVITWLVGVGRTVPSSSPSGFTTHGLIQLDDLLVVLLICRTDPLSLTPMPKAVLTKSYDRTYTTTSLGLSIQIPPLIFYRILRGNLQTPTIRQMQFLGRSLSSISKPVLRRGSSFRK